MDLRLSSKTFAATCGDDLVLLDIEDGTYASLPGCGTLVRLSDESSAARVTEPQLAKALYAAGALEPGIGEPRMRPEPPGYDLGVPRAAEVRAGDVVLLGRALAWMARSYWRAPFGTMLARTQAQARGACGEIGKIERATLAFRRMLPWVPLQGVCLYRSCLLLAFLRLNGLSASWVFGVQTFPFEAHCWLQAGDLVLDDDIEHVTALAPILALAP